MLYVCECACACVCVCVYIHTLHRALVSSGVRAGGVSSPPLSGMMDMHMRRRHKVL